MAVPVKNKRLAPVKNKMVALPNYFFGGVSAH
jgi:hypothetical protein